MEGHQCLRSEFVPIVLGFAIHRSWCWCSHLCRYTFFFPNGPWNLTALRTRHGLVEACIQLFHACFGNSQNCCPEVPWTARCTIARGQKVEGNWTSSCPRYWGAAVCLFRHTAMKKKERRKKKKKKKKKDKQWSGTDTIRPHITMLKIPLFIAKKC